MSIESELKEMLLGENAVEDNERYYGFESPQGPYDPAVYGEATDPYFQETPWDSTGTTLTDSETTDLAHQLMNVASEAEMEEFLGNFFKKISRGFGKAAKKVLPAVLKNGAPLLKAALPALGAAAGSFIPIPGVGTLAGGALGGALSQMIGEISYTSEYEAKLDLSKRLVQSVANAAAQAANDPNLAFDTANIAKRALTQQVQSNLTPSMRQLLAKNVLRKPRVNNVELKHLGGNSYDLRIRVEF